MRIFGYIRVSSRGQLAGDGPERQQDAINKFCGEHTLEIAGFFRDAHTGTAEAMDRPGFSSMMESIDAYPVHAIVVERMDRLARDLMVSELLLAECRKRNIKVFSVDQGQLIDMASDDGDPTRVLIRQLMGALAQWQKSELVLKLRKARERVRERTGRCEGPVRYGATESEARCLLLIGGMIEDGTPYRQIARFLNESEFKSRWGKLWSHRTVAKVWQRSKTKGK